MITVADSILRDKAKEFAKKTVFLCRDMKSSHKESVLINQLLRQQPLSEQTYTKLNMLKELRISFQNSK